MRGRPNDIKLGAAIAVRRKAYFGELPLSFAASTNQANIVRGQLLADIATAVFPAGIMLMLIHTVAHHPLEHDDAEIVNCNVLRQRS